MEQPTIQSLATETAERARACGVKPNKVVRMILRERHLPEDLSTDILRECGRRGGKSKRRNTRISEKTKGEIFAEFRRLELAREMDDRAKEAHEDTHPVN